MARKTISILLVAAIMLSLALPAFAAEADPAADVLGRSAQEVETTLTISVGCAWGKEIRFTYHESIAYSDWDPETLSYKSSAVAGSRWAADTDNTIRVDNKSNVPIQATFRWEPEAGYDGVVVATSENGFKLRSAEGASATPSRTVTAGVTEGSLANDETDYRLMGILVLGVQAIDPDDAEIPADPGPAQITVDYIQSIENRPATSSGLPAAIQGETVSLAALPETETSTGDSFTWDVEGPADIATEGVTKGVACGKNEIEIAIEDDAPAETTIAVTCAVKKANGLRKTVAAKLEVAEPPHVHSMAWAYVDDNTCAYKCSSCDTIEKTQAHNVLVSLGPTPKECENCKHVFCAHRNIVGSTDADCYKKCADCGQIVEQWTDHSTGSDGNCTRCGQRRCSNHKIEYDIQPEGHQLHCKACGMIYGSPEAHSFPNGLCGTCSDCGYVYHATTWSSTPDEHVKVCNICQSAIESGAHVWSDASDTTCDVCGYVRSLAKKYRITFKEQPYYVLSSTAALESLPDGRIPWDKLPTVTTKLAQYVHDGEWTDADTGADVTESTVLTKDVVLQPYVYCKVP